jgi:2-polyprenyl-3-methyl-5-hydroxy-6-metoxy-1,4-benzoquinol methylase
MFKVITDFPVALDSPDHIQPWGTMRDNSSNAGLVKEVLDKFGEGALVMDIGCSGGQWVRDLAMNGVNSIGLEGSDYSIKTNPREWWISLHNKNLFTCDCSKPFQVLWNEQPAKFKLITSWAVFEHFKEEDLPTVCENVLKHLDDDGIFIGNIGNEKCPEIINGWVLHQTVKPVHWWNELFSKYFDILDYHSNFKNVVRFDNNTFLVALRKQRR